jgi:hypothetical protein
MLAGLPMLAFAGADYLFAPPSDSTRSDPQIRQATINHRPNEARRAASHRQQIHPAQTHVDIGQKTGALVHVANRADEQPSANDTYSSLVAAIQRELTRVGCYAGESDGSWTSRTKVAMRAFNESVHVNLGTDQPDYILLTLLQGHNGKACSRPCNSAINAGTQCIDKAIEARRVPPVAPKTRQAAAGLPPGQTSSAARALAPVAPTWTTATSRPPVTAPPAHETEQQQAIAAAPAEPLPGRMSIGAPASVQPDPPEKVAAVHEDHPRPEYAPPPVRSRPAPVVRPAPPVSSRRSISRTFIELSRSSP